MVTKDAFRGRRYGYVLGAAIASWACSSNSDAPADESTGGTTSTGGDFSASGGSSSASSGSGGAAPSGGPSSGSGGASISAGGASASVGGTGTGGLGGTAGMTGQGGRATGGSSGAGAGGSSGSSGGPSAGGAPSGGSGGSGACDFSPPPADVADWIDQSWAGQLGNNVRTRKAWNLDHVILDKGEMSLCVRWGATSAVPDTVRMNLAATIERWFDDWWKGLGSYGCFPYGGGVKVKITGWAVRPGKESLLGGISNVPIYTETDSDGEPKCPDDCSGFVHWDHQFPNCPGGAGNHTDYWLWFDDMLPGGGGAAAVGGDWGLRMPVGTFTGAFNNASYLVVEHEMGHGFGFQDYYDWTGAKPNGGSIMIVGSTRGSQAPTTGDIWLLRRTWKEMKTLRNW